MNMNEENKYCTFKVDEYQFGVPVAQVQEIIRYQEMTDIPLAHPVVTGLINLRGQIVLAIDVRKRLGMGVYSQDLLPINVVIRSEDGPVSLMVDDIGDVMDVEKECMEAVPENIQGETREIIKEVCKLNEGLMLVINTEKLLTLNHTQESVQKVN